MVCCMFCSLEEYSTFEDLDRVLLEEATVLRDSLEEIAALERAVAL